MSKNNKKEREAVPVRIVGVILMTVYLIALSVFLLYSLIALWPRTVLPEASPEESPVTTAPVSPTDTVPGVPSDSVSPALTSTDTVPRPLPDTQPQQPEGPENERPTNSQHAVALFGIDFQISAEARLLLIVALAGALGSLIHALRSLYWYVGNRYLTRSWLVYYILLPFVGAILGVLFYLVIRGGFFSTGATIEATSPFGFAALAGLVGLFTEQAILKLKQVAENLLAAAQKGKDDVSEEGTEETGTDEEESEGTE